MSNYPSDPKVEELESGNTKNESLEIQRQWTQQALELFAKVFTQHNDVAKRNSEDTLNFVSRICGSMPFPLDPTLCNSLVQAHGVEILEKLIGKENSKKVLDLEGAEVESISNLLGMILSKNFGFDNILLKEIFLEVLYPIRHQLPINIEYLSGPYDFDHTDTVQTRRESLRTIFIALPFDPNNPHNTERTINLFLESDLMNLFRKAYNRLDSNENQSHNGRSVEVNAVIDEIYKQMESIFKRLFYPDQIRSLQDRITGLFKNEKDLSKLNERIKRKRVEFLNGFIALLITTLGSRDFNRYAGREEYIKAQVAKMFTLESVN